MVFLSHSLSYLHKQKFIARAHNGSRECKHRGVHLGCGFSVYKHVPKTLTRVHVSATDKATLWKILCKLSLRQGSSVPFEETKKIESTWCRYSSENGERAFTIDNIPVGASSECDGKQRSRVLVTKNANSGYTRDLSD